MSISCAHAQVTQLYITKILGFLVPIIMDDKKNGTDMFSKTKGLHIHTPKIHSCTILGGGGAGGAYCV